MNLNPNHPAVIEGRTIHPKMVKLPDLRILKSAADNQKLGKGKHVIQKGKWKGLPMYSLTLQERETCPRSCLHWRDCYGNNMGFARRIEHRDPLFLPLLEREIRSLAKHYIHGFVIRLHVLGDFYSKDYVAFWDKMLCLIPELHVFGYTARKWKILRFMRTKFPERWWIRFSYPITYQGGSLYAGPAEREFDGIQCPEQTGKTESCLTCGLCWSIPASIKFMRH